MTKSLVIISSCLSWTWLELNKTSLNRYIYNWKTIQMMRFFPYGFSSLVSCDHVVKPNRTCSSLPWPWGTSWNHCPAYLVPSCQTSPGRSQPTNQPTATAWHTGGTDDMTFPYQIPVTACWLHTWWRILVNAAVDDLMIWCGFFWRQKGWIQQVQGFKCGNRVLGQMAALSMGVQIGISRDCGIHRLLALPSLTNATHITLAEEILA